MRFFVDQCLTGLGKMLVRDRPGEVTYPGHEGIPEVPPGATDQHWMKAVAERGLIVITADKRIRTKPGERELIAKLALRVVLLSAKGDLRTADHRRLVEANWEKLNAFIDKRPAGPWFISITPSRGIVEHEIWIG